MTGMPASMSNVAGQAIWLGLDVAAKATVVLLLAIVANRLLNRRVLARAAVWNALLVGLILLPPATALFPRLRICCLPPAPPQSVTDVSMEPPSPAEVTSLDELSPTASDIGPQEEPTGDTLAALSDNSVAAADAEPSGAVESTTETLQPSVVPTQGLMWHWPSFVLYTYLLGATVLALRLVTSFLAVRRLRRESILPNDSTWSAALASWRERLGIRQPVQLAVSAAVSVPIQIGWLKPMVILPAELIGSLDPSRHGSILLHELAHVRRRDYAWQILLKLVQIIYWPHPLIWLAGRMIGANREQVCDDLCVHHSSSAGQYRATLLEVASALVRRPAASLGIAMARTSKIGGRLERIERGCRLSRCLTRWPVRLAIVAVVLAGACMIAPVELAHREAATEAAPNATPATLSQPAESPTPPAINQAVSDSTSQSKPAALIASEKDKAELVATWVESWREASEADGLPSHVRRRAATVIRELLNRASREHPDRSPNPVPDSMRASLRRFIEQHRAAFLDKKNGIQTDYWLGYCMAESAFRETLSASAKTSLDESHQRTLSTLAQVVREGYEQKLTESDRAKWAATLADTGRTLASGVAQLIRQCQHDPLCPAFREPLTEDSLAWVTERLRSWEYPAYEDRVDTASGDAIYRQRVERCAKQITRTLLFHWFTREVTSPWKRGNTILGRPTWNAGGSAITERDDGRPAWPAILRVNPATEKRVTEADEDAANAASGRNSPNLGEGNSGDLPDETATKPMELPPTTAPEDAAKQAGLEALKEKPAWGRAEGGLQCRLVIPHEGPGLPKLAPNKATLARLLVRNVSDRPIRLADCNEVDGGFNAPDHWFIGLELSVTVQGSTSRFFMPDDRGYWGQISGGHTDHFIQPGRTNGFTVNLQKLINDRGTKLLSLHGPYALQASLHPVKSKRSESPAWTGQISSPQVMVEISDEAPASLLPWSPVRSAPMLGHLFFGPRRTPLVIDAYEGKLRIRTNAEPIVGATLLLGIAGDRLSVLLETMIDSTRAVEQRHATLVVENDYGWSDPNSSGMPLVIDVHEGRLRFRNWGPESLMEVRDGRVRITRIEAGRRTEAEFEQMTLWPGERGLSSVNILSAGSGEATGGNTPATRPSATTQEGRSGDLPSETETITTGSLSGIVYLPDGRKPATGIKVAPYTEYVSFSRFRASL